MKPTLELIYNFLKKLDEHSSWNSLPTADRLEMIAIGIKIFPASYFKGHAFRVINEETKQSHFSSQIAGELASSWSKNLEGCSHFLVDIINEDQIHNFSGLIIEAKISGFSVHTWIELYKNLKTTHPQYPEVPDWVNDRIEEIILVEIDEIVAFKNFTFDLQRDPNLIIT